MAWGDLKYKTQLGKIPALISKGFISHRKLGNVALLLASNPPVQIAKGSLHVLFTVSSLPTVLQYQTTS
jgi:hypothetical protein